MLRNIYDFGRFKTSHNCAIHKVKYSIVVKLGEDRTKIDILENVDAGCNIKK